MDPLIYVSIAVIVSILLVLIFFLTRCKFLRCFMTLLIVFDSKLLEANVSTTRHLTTYVMFFSLANGNAAEQAAAPVEPVRARPAAAAREGTSKTQRPKTQSRHSIRTAG
jgi:hypothetical protein